MESKSSVNRFWYVVNSIKCKCNKLSNLFNCLVLSQKELLRSDFFVLKVVQCYTGVGLFMTGYLRD